MSESVSMGELLQWQETRPFFLFPMLPKDGVFFIAAPPKHMKSLVAMQLAYNLAAGSDFLGWKVDAPVERIMYIEQEIGRNETRDRMVRFHKHFVDPSVVERIRFVTRPKQRFSFDKGSKGLVELRNELEQYRPQVVIFDPFRKMTAHDENSSTEMTKTFATLAELQAEFEFAAILIHHSGKPSESRKQGTPEAMRGSSEIYAHGDTYMMITRPNDKDNAQIDLHFTFRHAPDIDSIQLNYLDNSHFARRSTATPKRDKSTTGDKPTVDASIPSSTQSTNRTLLKGLKIKPDPKETD